MIKAKILKNNDEYEVYLWLDGESQLIFETHIAEAAKNKVLSLKKEIPFLQIEIDLETVVDLAGLPDVKCVSLEQVEL